MSIKFLKNKLMEGLVNVNGPYVEDDKYTNYVKFVNDNLFENKLTIELEKSLINGSGSELKDKGNTPAKIRSTASSSALMVNLMLSLDFDKFTCMGNKFNKYNVETKLSTKLSTANLDGELVSEKTRVFIESKLLESYYEKPKNLNKNYLISNRISNEWKELLKSFLIENYEENKIIIQRKNGSSVEFSSIFRYYNGIQMLLHALAIYYDIVDNPDKYKGTDEVKLLNLVWKNPFEHQVLSSIDSDLRNELIKTDFFDRLNIFMNKQLADKGVKFEVVYKTYNEFVEDHKFEFKPKGYEYLIKRYYL